MFCRKYKKYFETQGKEVLFPGHIEVIWPFQQEVFFLFSLTIVSIQGFYNESTLGKNKAHITPEINL